MSKCKQCGGCCNHVAIELDKPTSKDDYHTIMWFLVHKNVKVWVNDEGEWYLEFLTNCKWYSKKGCKKYKKRPKMCRDYCSSECVKNGSGKAEKDSFTTRDQFIRFLKKKKKNYQFKKFKV